VIHDRTQQTTTQRLDTKRSIAVAAVPVWESRFLNTYLAAIGRIACEVLYLPVERPGQLSFSILVDVQNTRFEKPTCDLEGDGSHTKKDVICPDLGSRCSFCLGGGWTVWFP
jgi:hypothetical protein